MSDEVELKEDPLGLETTPSQKVAGDSSQVGDTEKRPWFKGMLPMAICCGAPLLLVGAIALFGLSLGAVASGFLSLAVVLACPLGMYFMMRMMMNNKK